jgi:hypothetical protein
MSAHAESLSLPDPPVGPLSLAWAFVTTFVAMLRRCASEPSMPRMSEHWLLSLDRDSSRFVDQ